MLRDDGCSQVVDLEEHKRADVLRLVREGRVFKLVHAFLLASPSKQRGMLADFDKALAEIERKGGAVKDVHTGLISSDPPQRVALRLLVKDQIRRDRQGYKSASNGKRMKGRQLVVFAPQQLRDAKAIWRDLVDYPTWDVAESALAEIKTEKGEKFTPARAHKLWGPRTRKG